MSNVVARSPNYTIESSDDRMTYLIVNARTGVIEVTEPMLPKALSYMQQLEEELSNIMESDAIVQDSLGELLSEFGAGGSDEDTTEH